MVGHLVLTLSGPSLCASVLNRGFPSWVAEGGSSPLTNSTAMYVTKWVLGAKREHGLDIDYVGIWNEHSYSRDYILTLRRHLDEANLTSTHIIVADGGWGICDDMIKDPPYAAAVYAVGAHYPNSQTTANCAALGKPLWASEDFSTSFTAGGCWSRLLNRNYAFSNLTSTISWNLVSAYYDELPWSALPLSPPIPDTPSLPTLVACSSSISAWLTIRCPVSPLCVCRGGVGLAHAPQPWSGWYEVGSVFWVTAHHTQFTNYGWHYLGHGSGVGHLANGGTYVSLTDGQGNLTVIIEAMSQNVSHCQYSSGPNTPVTTQEVTLQLGGGFEGVKAMNVFYSSMNPATPTWFVYKGQVEVVNGAVTLTVQPDELYTLSTLNGTKSSFPSPPPPKQPFPLPYADSFDSYAVSSFPHYFDDQSGSFEIVAATNTSHGNVVRQMVPHIPVAWCGDAPLTFTVLGDHSWRAVRAEVDVLIETNGTAYLAVAVNSGGCVGQGGSSGVAFGFSVDGSWVVSNTTTLRSVLARGKTSYAAGQWVRLGVELGEGGTAVSLDGKEVAMVAELTSARHNGWVTLGSSYDYVQYDNLRISQNTSRTAKREESVGAEKRAGAGKVSIALE